MSKLIAFKTTPGGIHDCILIQGSVDKGFDELDVYLRMMVDGEVISLGSWIQTQEEMESHTKVLYELEKALKLHRENIEEAWKTTAKLEIVE